MNLLLTFLATASITVAQYKADIDALDRALETRTEASVELEGKIKLVESMLAQKNLSNVQRYIFNDQLYSLCFSYQFDRALSAADSKIDAARRIDDSSMLFEAVLDKATVLCMAGFYLESRMVIEEAAICEETLTPDQKLRFYYYLQHYYIDFHSYYGGGGDEEVRKAIEYRQLIVDSTPEDSKLHLEMATLLSLSQGDFHKADSLSVRWLDSVQYRTLDYSVSSFYAGLIQERLGNTEKAIHLYAESAISDIENSVKDNASINSLSRLLLKEGDVDRSFRYMQVALSDAIFYKSKLRPLQIMRSLPSIEEAYSRKIMEDNRRIRISYDIVVVLALILLVILTLLFVQNRRQTRSSLEIQRLSASVSEANRKLSESLKDVSESNLVKEEYLGLFLTMCSSYMTKLKKYQSIHESEQELANFYDIFDNAFLHLYPTFVEDFNALLKPESRIELKKGSLLNTELRIFALIRLGIDQSSHIASFLRYSVNTIYNYRAQIKNDSICRNNFEERIRLIGNSK